MRPPDDEAPDDAEVDPQAELRKIVLPAASHGLRLDQSLVVVVPEFSRSYLQQLILADAVTLNGAKVGKPSLKVRAGDEVVVELRPTPESQAFLPEAMALDVRFEDAHFLIVNKPAGLVVHPAPGNWSGTLLNGLLAYCRDVRLLPRAGIVHRLDKDTSGLMVVARTRSAMDQLIRMIAAREVSREYVAIGQGAWQGSKTTEVNESIGRDARNRLRMAVVDTEKSAGKAASTVISVLGTRIGPPDFCLVRCKLRTGRTHQIRVHMAFLRHPLVGDPLYGGAGALGLHRQALHACRLAFKHPVSGEPMEFLSQPPADFLAALSALGLGYNWNE